MYRTRTDPGRSGSPPAVRARLTWGVACPAREALDDRKRVLLHAVVDQYVRSAEPVPSDWLASTVPLGLRAATIRNELAEMTELGYLRQPHTSAGRIPSSQGYRYFVEYLMEETPLRAESQRELDSLRRLDDGDIARLLLQTCRVLSSLTRYTSMAAAPAGDRPRIRQIHLVQIAARRVLLVVVLEAGEVRHRFADLPQDLTPAEVDRLANYLGERYGGRPLGESPERPADEMAPYQPTLRILCQALEVSGDLDPDDPFFFEGTSRMLEQPEFRVPDRLEPLVRYLEQRRGEMIRQMHALLADQVTTVVIGEENPEPELRDCSFVSARYLAGDRMHGWIGVVGPTRMDYARTIPAVEGAAAVLTEVFARMAAG